MLPKKRNSGFLLLEVLISIVIVASVLVVINRAFSFSLKATRQASDYMLASCALEDRMFDLEIESGYDDANLSSAIEAGNKKFLYTILISEANPVEIIKDEDIESDFLYLKKAALGLNWFDENPDNAGNISRLNVSTYVWAKQQK